MSGPLTWLTRFIGWMLAVAVLVLAFLFSVVLLALLLVAGVAMLGYLWWKSRSGRRNAVPPDGDPNLMREPAWPDAGKTRPAIEGESRRED